MFKKSGLLIILFFTVLGTVSAVELRSYYVTCDSAQFAYMNNNPFDDIKIPCLMEYGDSTWHDLEIELRGESSLEYPKKSYSIRFESGETFYQRDKINLISEYLDATYSYEYISYDLFRRAGIEVSHCWFARLYVNGEYRGLYLDVENVDDCFLDMTGYDNGGSIYKASDAGSMLSSTEDAEDLWEKKTNEETGFYDLNNLIYKLNNVPTENFRLELDEIFDIDNLTTAIAANSLLGNQSTYYHNYFLIHDMDEGGKWSWVPWDMDKTFIFWSNYTEPGYFRSGHQVRIGVNPLIARSWTDDILRQDIFNKIEWLSDNLYTYEYFDALKDTLAEVLYDAVLEDNYKQFTIEDFINGLYNIPNMAQERSEAVLNAIENNPFPFNINKAMMTPAGIYFSWTQAETKSPSAVNYKLQFSNSYLFDQNVVTFDNIAGTDTTIADLTPGYKHWRVYAKSSAGTQSRCIAYFDTITVPADGFGGTVITDTLNVSTVISADDGSLFLPEGLTIAENCTLTVEPGVIIGVGDNGIIRVEGVLNLEGEPGDSVKIMPVNMQNRWNAITVAGGGAANIVFASFYGGIMDSADAGPGMIIVESGGILNMSDSRMQMGSGAAVHSEGGKINIERTILTDFGSSAIYADSGTLAMRDCFIDRCCIYAYNVDLVYIANSNNGMEVSGCTILCSGEGDDGISLKSVIGGTIAGNYISGIDDKGINLHDDSYDIAIFNNIIEYCDEGICMQDDSYGEIYNNVIVSNDEGITFKDFDKAGALVRNCVLWENNVNILNAEWVELDIAYCLIGANNPYPGEGNIYLDPEFTDPWNSNYYPLANSPLIDAGYGTGYPLFDRNDSTRVDILSVPNAGSGGIDCVDIGVFEFYSPDYIVVPPPPSPAGFYLNNYPNPFNNATQVKFFVKKAGIVDFKIYNILGQLAAEYSIDAQTAGWMTFRWDNSENKTRLSSGIYFGHILFDGEKETVKMMMVK